MIHAYRRVSKDEQTLGPQVQQEAILRWRGGRQEELRDWFDNGVSGGLALRDRPQGAEMLAALQPGDTMVTYKLDRAFRSTADAALTIDDWCRRGIVLVSLQEGFDLSSPYGRAMAQIMSAMAELERAMIRERTRAALQAKKARGERVGTVPYGWDSVGGKLVENPAEQAVIQDILSWYAAGLRMRRIAERLNERKVPAKKLGLWGVSSISAVLKRHGGRPSAARRQDAD
jgi:DNA invertase Pin-like site-specific DNA recombinase